MASSLRRAAALVRVSTDQQANHGGSIDDQLQRIRMWCDRRGIELVATYGQGDRSGGKLETSPDFVRMLAEAPSSNWDMLVVESTDRFRRNLLDALEARKRLAECGKSLFILNAGDEDMTVDGPSFAMFVMQGLQAHSERNSFVERGHKGHRTKISRATWNGGWAPTGYRAIRKQGTRGLERHPEYAEHMEFLWERLKAGWATHRIARALAERGCRPVRGTKPFSQPTVNQIAHNPIHAGHNWAYDEQGKKIPGKLGLKGDWPAYVSAEDWLKVQALMRDRKHSPRVRRGRPSLHFLLARGLARCGRCGEVLWTRKDAHADYYYCASKKTPTPCGAAHYPRRLVDPLMRDYILEEGLVDVDAALARARDQLATERTAAAKSVRRLRSKTTKLQHELNQLASEELDAAMTHLYRLKHEALVDAENALQTAQNTLAKVEAAEPTAEERRIALDAFQARFRNEDEDIAGLQDQLAASLDHVTITHGTDYHDAPSPNDRPFPPDLIIIQPSWKPSFMRSLLVDLETNDANPDQGVDSVTGRNVDTAWRRNRRRRVEIRERGRAPPFAR